MKASTPIIALSLSAIFMSTASACTEVILNKKKDLVISGRTLDYNSELGSRICFVEKGSKTEDPGVKWTQFEGAPLSWTSKYNAVLVDAFNEKAYVDGMNSEGLSVACLWQADTQLPQAVTEGTKALSNVALVEYLAENAKDVDEAKKLVTGLSLFLSNYKGQPMVLHWIVNDKSGKSTVIEIKDGKPKFFDEVSKIGVMANQPSYDQQLDNLKSHKSEQAQNTKAYVLPGDYQSKNRFVRSEYLVSHLPPFETADEGVAAAIQILHNVESPKGAQNTGSYTQWIAVRDQSNLRYWFLSANRQAPKLVDFKNLDFKSIAGKCLAIDSASSGDVSKLPELTAAK